MTDVRGSTQLLAGDRKMSKKNSTGDYAVDLMAVLALLGLIYVLVSLGAKMFFGQS